MWISSNKNANRYNKCMGRYSSSGVSPQEIAKKTKLPSDRVAEGYATEPGSFKDPVGRQTWV